MPIYEFYCPDNNRLYTFFARNAEQAARIPLCPDNPGFGMERYPPIGKPVAGS